MENEYSPLMSQQTTNIDYSPLIAKTKHKSQSWKYVLIAVLSLSLIGLITWLVINTNKENKSISKIPSLLQTQTESNDSPHESPNIIFVVVDDIGFGDISYHGAEFNTPVFDELVSKNSIFMDSHYTLLCTSSRSQFLTGRYAFNMGIATLSPFEDETIAVLPHQIPLISDVLKKYTNYQTYSFGKWHLGYVTQDALPNNRGFDYFWGFHGGAVDYYSKLQIDIDNNYYHDWFENYEADYSAVGGFSTIQTTEKITSKLKAIDEHQNHDPFFMYVAVQAPHVPITFSSDKATQALCAHITNQTRNYYCQNIIEIDHLMGNMVTTLKDSKTNLWDNTIIVFTSDNGGEYNAGGCNAPYAGNKGQYFEGSIRTLTFITGGYDGIKSQYGTTRTSLFHGTDWTPTFLSLIMNSKQYKQSLIEFETSYEIDGFDQSKMILFGDKYGMREDAPIMITSNPSDDNAIIFVYDNIRYKYINTTGDRAYIMVCTYDEETGERTRVDPDFDGSEIIFELDTDPFETTNLLKATDDASERVHNIYEYALNKLDEYRSHKYFNDFLDCFDDRTMNYSKASLTDGEYKPFLTNQQFNYHFDQKCGDQVNDQLKPLFYATIHN